jgi:hypothetical protein
MVHILGSLLGHYSPGTSLMDETGDFEVVGEENLLIEEP